MELSMKQIKPQEIIWDWDWLPDGPTALCPFCHDTDGGHSGACGCIKQCKTRIKHENLPCVKSAWWEAAQDSVALGLAPLNATPEMIQGYIDYLINVYKEGKYIKWNDDPIFTEDHYLRMKRHAVANKMDFPSFEELSKTIGQNPPFYNCKTGEKWELEDGRPRIKIVNPIGWDSEESFKNDRITWSEFCSKRCRSELDYRELAKSERGTRFAKTMVGDIQQYQRMRIMSGIKFGHKATVLQNKKNKSTVVVLIDGEDVPIEMSKYNGADRIYSIQKYLDFLEKDGFEQDGYIWKKTFEDGTIEIINLQYQKRKPQNQDNLIQYKESLEDMLIQICGWRMK